MERYDIENKLIQGDCIEEMKKLPENSVDAIITDPPYGLEFMGKEWDKFKEGKNIAGGTKSTEEGSYWKKRPHIPSFYQLSKKKRFGKMGEEGENDLKVKKNFKVLPRFFQSDMNTLQQFCFNWASACLRVLKPGGYLLSMGGTRTYHRLVCGIEDAGFEIRDTIMWIYGSGFPKSLNIGKQIDKLQENEREKLGFKKGQGNIPNDRGEWGLKSNTPVEITRGSSEWEGWGTALKPACEPIVVARKPLSEKNVALNVLKWGTGGINIDACRVECDNVLDKSQDRTMIQSADGKEQGWGMKPQGKTQVLDLEKGRFPANIILECTCDELKKGKIIGKNLPKNKEKSNADSQIYSFAKYPDMHKSGAHYQDKIKIHTNPNCPCYMLDEQSGNKTGQLVPTTGKEPSINKLNQIYGDYRGYGNSSTPKDNLGGASRFFYCAKASKSERNFGLDDLPNKTTDDGREVVSDRPHQRGATQRKNNHPTVKPIKLMEYLIKLVSREGATVLDPFLGSGTTAIACLKLNRFFIGIEKEEEYVKIAKARIKPFLDQKKL